MKNDFKNMIFAGLTLFFIIFGVTVAAADEINITLVSTFETDGQASDIDLKSNYAYIADSENGLVIVDVSDPSSPVLAGRSDVNGSADNVAVEGDYAYVTDENNGLRIIDVSHPSLPVLVGNYDTGGTARGLAVSQNHAYVADGSNGLVVINVSDPTSPILAGNFSQPGFRAFDVAVENDYAYVASDSGLFTFDVNNPESPALTGTNNPGFYVMDFQYEAITVSDNRTYSIDSYNRLFIDDIGDPSSPVTYKNSTECSPAASTPGTNVGVVVLDNYAYAGSEHFGIVNVSDPSSPFIAGYYDTEGAACSVAVSGDYAYVTDSRGLVILLMEKAGTTPAKSIHIEILSPEAGLLMDPNESILIQAKISDIDGSQLQDPAETSVKVTFNNSETPVYLFDDGNHSDGNTGDGIYANEWMPGNISNISELEYTITVLTQNPASEEMSDGISGLIVFNDDINSTSTDAFNSQTIDPEKNSGSENSAGISSSGGGTASSGGESGDLTYKDAEPETESKDSVISSEAGTMDSESGLSSFESSEEQESSEKNPAYSKEWALGFVLVSVGIIAVYSITGKRR